MVPTASERGSKCLFGGPQSPWRTSCWTASDDRVRGGRSTSHVRLEQGLLDFYGCLDVTALGGAGFASQRTGGEFPELDLSPYDALVLDVPRSDSKRYTLFIKDTVLPARDDGRERSTINWEYDFRCQGADGGGRVVASLRDFRPVYRGRPKGDAAPLDLTRVKRIGIMLRSFFGEQEGSFTIVIASITAIRHGSSAKPAPAGHLPLADEDGGAANVDGDQLPDTSRSYLRKRSTYTQ